MRPGRLLRRKAGAWTVVLSAALLACVTWVGPAAAATLTNGHGLSTCAVGGSLSFNPPLQSGATGTSAVTTTFDLTGCGGADFTQSSKTITGGSASSVGADRKVPGGCPSPSFAPGTNTAVSSFAKLRFKVSWTTATGSVAASTITMLNSRSTWTGSDGPTAAPGATQSVTLWGARKAEGTFGTPTKNLNAFKLSLLVDQDFSDQTGAGGCSSSTGLAQVTFTGTLLLP